MKEAKTYTSTILIIDDNPTNLEVLSHFLTAADYKVLVKKEGASGLSLALRKQPDLILLDILMPELDGYQTCQQLKKQTVTAPIPVIFMSALTETVDKVKGFEAGAVDYITKPFQAEEVLARVKTHLTVVRMQKSLAEQNLKLQQEVEQRKLMEQMLFQSRSLLNNILNSSQDGILVLQAIRSGQGQVSDFEFLIANPAAGKILENTKQTLIGKRLLVTFPDFKHDPLFAEYVSVVETGQPLKKAIYYHHALITGWFHLVAVKLGDGLSVTIHNISELKDKKWEAKAL